MKVVGRKSILVDVLEDGTMRPYAIKKIRFEKPVSHLDDIWISSAKLTREMFVSQMIRLGVVDDKNFETPTWIEGSISITSCFQYLCSVNVLQKVDSVKVFKAFSGTFTLPHVKTARSLQLRNNTTRATREKEKYWRKFFETRLNIFVQ